MGKRKQSNGEKRGTLLLGVCWGWGQIGPAGPVWGHFGGILGVPCLRSGGGPRIAATAPGGHPAGVGAGARWLLQAGGGGGGIGCTLACLACPSDRVTAPRLCGCLQVSYQELLQELSALTGCGAERQAHALPAALRCRCLAAGPPLPVPAPVRPARPAPARRRSCRRPPQLHRATAGV